MEFVDDGGYERKWYATNLVGISARDLASPAFNAQPVSLRLAATRETHPGLFVLLAQTSDLAEAASVFAHYMAVAFELRAPAQASSPAESRAYRSSYLKLLQGWGFDSNSPQGAVLKGWVESRFGIPPTFHTAPLTTFPSAAWLRYLEEKLGSRFHNNCISMQLDVLYEYCQWSIERFGLLGPRHVTLYRGANRAEESFLEGSLRERAGLVRLNSLVSFSASRERAEEFGDLVLEVEVPCVKVLFYPGLLASRVLNGERETLVIGGDYRVKVSYA